MLALLLAGVWVTGISPTTAAEASATSSYQGMCDASAAIAVGTDYFLVASDEDSVLRLYRANQPGSPVQVFDLTAHLTLDNKHPETDIEGAAPLGDLTFWITSHGRNAEGKARESRGRLFAVRLRENGGQFTLALEGRPYRQLLADLLAAPELASLGLAAAAAKAPKEPGALNIEGLAATPERTLLIGFRNPIIQDQALLVPLLNPLEVITGARARLGKARFLDLAGRGVRDMVWLEDRYVIVAGSADGRGKARLYEWRPDEAEPRRLAIPLPKQFTPEALVVYPETLRPRFLLLSDDGTREIDGCKCKELKDPARRVFRAFWQDTLAERAASAIP